MSWFQSLQTATEAIKKVGGEQLSELSNKVQGVLPPDSVELINKLTLRSDELLREHELIDAQEKRKELVREYLSEILPWETKDESKAILVDQCQEAILNLSTEKATFETPFLLQKGFMFTRDETATEVEQNDIISQEQIEASRLKLEKMQPLPLLLEHFDIDTHVGLIERLLKSDKQLVHMHSMLSGAGEKETTFWKNYFFHCAYTRYEKGLSIDEIWSQKPKASITNDMSSIVSKASDVSLQQDMINDDGDDLSVELQIEDDNKDSSILNDSHQSQTIPTNPMKKINVESSGVLPSAGTSGQSVSSGSGNSYEIVNETPINNDDEEDLDDLDDLEAEIARELGED